MKEAEHALTDPEVGVEGEGENALGAGEAAGAVQQRDPDGIQFLESPQGSAIGGGLPAREFRGRYIE